MKCGGDEKTFRRRSRTVDLAAEVEAIARNENKSLSAVVQDALRALKLTIESGRGF
jgi:hypothetical protein